MVNHHRNRCERSAKKMYANKLLSLSTHTNRERMCVGEWIPSRSDFHERVKMYAKTGRHSPSLALSPYPNAERLCIGTHKSIAKLWSIRHRAEPLVKDYNHIRARFASEYGVHREHSSGVVVCPSGNGDAANRSDNNV